MKFLALIAVTFAAISQAVRVEQATPEEALIQEHQQTKADWGWNPIAAAQTESKLAILFQLADKNRDGRISWDEIVKLVHWKVGRDAHTMRLLGKVWRCVSRYPAGHGTASRGQCKAELSRYHAGSRRSCLIYYGATNYF